MVAQYMGCTIGIKPKMVGWLISCINLNTQQYSQGEQSSSNKARDRKTGHQVNLKSLPEKIKTCIIFSRQPNIVQQYNTPFHKAIVVQVTTKTERSCLKTRHVAVLLQRLPVHTPPLFTIQFTVVYSLPIVLRQVVLARIFW